MRLKFLSILFTMILACQVAIASQFNANAKTKRIPAGTKFQLQLLSPVSTYNTTNRDFSAILLTEQTADTDVILPSGSLVRGSIRDIVPSKRMSKGAVLYLDFDHVVTPNGRQLPLTLSLVGRTDMTNDGGITTTKGYGDAIKQSWAKTVDITKNSIEWGDDIVGGSAAKYVTVPLAAIGGGIGGGAYFIYDSVADMIRKGKDVTLFKGDTLNVILVDPIDVPVL